MMNCDRVFEVLTRGPFPTGDDSDVLVESHLSACHECRQLAEALRPAVALFHEAVAVTEGSDLPSYRGSHAPFEAEITPVSIDWRNPPKPATAKTNRWSNVFRFASAALIGAALLILFRGVIQSVQGGRTISNHPNTAQFQPGPEGKATLASLKLPVSCQPLEENSADFSADFSAENSATMQTSGTYHCCTKCHTAARQHSPGTAPIAKVAKSCSACHDS